MNILTMEHITRAYTNRVVLDDVNFSINDHDKIGVIGVNGMGKSTLLKIIAGVETCDAGKISLRHHTRIAYLPQTPVFGEEETVLEAVLGELLPEQDRWSAEAEARAMLNSLGITGHEDRVARLSGGQKKRVALVRTLLTPSEILVLDEPTNHLDNAMAEYLEGYLTARKGALVLVTHDRYFLDRVVNRIVEVDQGKLYTYPGSYADYVRLREARLDSALATERKRKSLLRTELQWLMRGARARSTKQKAHIDRIRAMQAIEDISAESTVEMTSLASRMGRKTVEADGLGMSRGGRQLFSGFSYHFLKNDRIGIIGPNGCGKTTLLKILAGRLTPDAGTVEVGQTVKIGFFSQENEELDGSLRAIDYIREVGEYIRTPEGLVSASSLMERFLFDGTMSWSRIDNLSGGERRRLYLMRILMGAPNVLILDEPTNDLDIRTLTVLEDYLDAFEGIVITVSHDRYFLDRTVRRLFAFEDGTIRRYEGNYSDYLIRQAVEEAEAAEKAAAGAARGRSGNRGVPTARRGAAGDTDGSSISDGGKPAAASSDSRAGWKVREKKLRFTFSEAREFETIEEDIASLEAEIGRLHDTMAAHATDAARLTALTAELEAAEQALSGKMERWVYLTELNDRIREAGS